jgi:hypothetical protein
LPSHQPKDEIQDTDSGASNTLDEIYIRFRIQKSDTVLYKNRTLRQQKIDNLAGDFRRIEGKRKERMQKKIVLK